MNKPLIVWEKWRDPFGDNEDDETLSSFNNYENEQDDGIVVKKTVSKVLLTPMGIVPYNDNTASSKIFNFWLGHTNFSINQILFDIIDNIEGVETFDLFTRYRFRIGIGKAFDDSTVMRDINKQLYSKLGHISSDE